MASAQRSDEKGLPKSISEPPTFDPHKPLPPLTPGLGEESAHRGMAQFQEMMRQQLEGSMYAELQKLLGTASGADKEVGPAPFPRLCPSLHLVVISEKMASEGCWETLRRFPKP